MENCFALCLQQLKNNQSCVLATILSKQGSAPRGAGAMMIVTESGETQGTVGGGALEHAVCQAATACLAHKVSRLVSYQLTPGAAEDLGMVCGGSVQVFCQRFSPLEGKDQTLLRRIGELLAQEKRLWLAREISSQGEMRAATLCDESGLLLGDSIPFEKLRPLCQSSPVLVREASLWFVQPLGIVSRAYLFGGGHISQELAPLLQRLDFSPAIYEDRPDFLRPELFPTVRRLILGAFDRISLPLTAEDYAVIMTRGHVHDHELLTQILRSPVTYIGLIGSRSKIETTRTALLREGFSQTDFERVHTPVGLAIGAETPAEIAVSIAGEMILHRARRNGNPKAPAV